MLRAYTVIIHTPDLEGASRKVASLQVESHLDDNDNGAEEAYEPSGDDDTASSKEAFCPEHFEWHRVVVE